jgi:hypothetical protein
MDLSVIIGSVGVTLLLISFFLNLFKKLKQDTVAYTLMNVIGAGMSCYASYMIDYIPFVVLEATWSLVALVGLIKVIMATKKA